ncbi:MAG: hypothetical protein AAF383_03615 [Cyanobacteria bacterium P01_A01_bin.83]
MLFSNVIIFLLSLPNVANAQDTAQDTINVIAQNWLPIDDGEPLFPFPKIDDRNYFNSEPNYSQWDQTSNFIVLDNYVFNLDKKIEISSLLLDISDLEFQANQLPNLVIPETNKIWINQN